MFMRTNVLCHSLGYTPLLLRITGYSKSVQEKESSVLILKPLALTLRKEHTCKKTFYLKDSNTC